MVVGVVVKDGASGLAQGRMGFGVWDMAVEALEAQHWYSAEVGVLRDGAAHSYSCDGEVVVVPWDKEMVTCHCEDPYRARGVAHMAQCNLAREFHRVRELEASAAE